MPDKLSKQELVVLVSRIIDADGTEDEISEMISIVESNVPHPSITDLIYYSDEDLTPSHVVEIALADRPIEL